MDLMVTALGAVKRRVAAAGGSIHFEHSILGYFDVVSTPTRPKNRIGECSLIDAILDKGFIDVDRNDFTKDEPTLHRFALPVLELDDLGNLAFHCRTTLAHARNADMPAGRNRQSSSRKLTYTVRNGGGRPVHLFAKVFGHEIPDKFARF